MSLFKNQTRLAMAYTNEVGDKIYPVIVDIKKGIKSTEDIQFVSSDVNTGILSVAFIQGNDNYNVTGADVVCSVMRPDASTLELPCEVVGENIVEVPLGINGTSQDGVYSFDFKVFKGENKVVGTPIMSYSVSLSIDNDMAVEEDDRLPVLTVLMTQLTELKGEARESINQANTATEASREATAKAIEATNNANAVSERVSQETSETITRVDNKIQEVETRFNTLTSSQQQSSEVIDARDGETSLKARLDRDIEKAKQVYVELEGSYISTESSTGAIQDLEILGNTVQDPNNLADIKSVGELQEDGTYKMSILSCGKNLFNGEFIYGTYTDGVFSDNGGMLANKSPIRVKQNTSYYIKRVGLVSGKYTRISYYDINMTFLSSDVGGDRIFTTPKDCCYINFHNEKPDVELKVMISEGEYVTEYEPYQEDKLTILSPVQLEKVGDVSDRLYYDDVEKAWCIEKNVESYTITNYSRFLSDSSLSNVYRIYIDIDKNIGSGIKNIISSIIPYRQNMSWLQNEEGCYTDSSASYSNRIWFHINKSKISGDVETYFKNLLPVTIEYQTTTPQKIVLPLSTQIALNSFFGTTHIYMESGEVEGTIKCKIPKSLGATVQSLNNKTDILSDRIEAIEGLKDSQNMKYETDKGYLVCKETKNGVIDDLKIEGKTLVNLAEQPTNNGSINNQYATISKVTNIKPSTEYTYIIRNNGSETLKLYLNNNGGFDWFELDVEANSTVIGKAETLPSIDGDIWLSLNKAETMEQNLQVVLLEGDHTQNPPSYFEGLMSVGQDVDKIEVLSDNNKINNIDNVFATIDIASGEVIGINNRQNIISGFNLVSNDTNSIKLYDKDMNVVSGSANYNDISRRYYDKNYNYLGANLTDNAFFVRYRCLTTNNYEMGGLATDYIFKDLYQDYSEYTRDKKQILFYNENGELEPIQELHEWDSIEKHSDNKWYYHKRSGKVVLNGIESEWNVNTQTDTTMRFEINMVSKNMAGNRNPIICDKFNLLFNYELNCVEEGVFTSIKGSTLFLNILKSKLSTQDVQGFKQWLQANNVTVVYQLAQEEVYELAPLHLDSYANETLILCNSGAINPKMEFSITSHINELVKSQGDRISLLEEKMYKALKQVLAGDMYSLAELLYPEDFVEENPENEIMLLPFE